MNKKQMLERLEYLMGRDWFHYMADRMTATEKQQWLEEKEEFVKLKAEYEAKYGKLPQEIENWSFHIRW